MTRFSILALLLLAQGSLAAEHMGNVFVAGEDVHVSVPATWAGWRAVDIDGKEVGQGAKGETTTKLGALPVGYYELLETDGPGKITAAVVAKVTPAEDTPIAIDVAASWFYPDQPEVIRAACRLCRLAGVQWVRDRVSWPEIETERGKFAGETRYERAMRLQHEEGMKVLQVNHISPPWAASDPKRFPEDLRDVFNFYRGLAERWKGLADAIEPWNEPDIEMFGGHTGCEIASFQKAAYLGLKAGDPNVPACQSVFAIDREETLNEFGANEVYPYFNIYNLHHYTALPAYARVYGRHRALSGGRPMWTTEFNLPIHWADEKTHEPTEEDLRVHGYRVPKVYAHALFEGSEMAFYFILGHYVEYQRQYGLVHTDLTPRPAYVSFAAVGRLLNGAKPIGRVYLGDEKLNAYVFKTLVDGEERETLVAWSETKPTKMETSPAEKQFDYLGREQPLQSQLELTRSPVFLILPPRGSRKLTITSPPVKPAWRDGAACPVVLQLAGKADCNHSAFVLDETKSLRLVAYNFGSEPARGALKLEGATGAVGEIELAPGERTEWTINSNGADQITARAALGELGNAIVSARVLQTAPAPKDKK